MRSRRIKWEKTGEEKLPENSITYFEIEDNVRSQFEQFGLKGGVDDEDRWNEIEWMILDEAWARFETILAHYGVKKGLPFILRKSNIRTGHWVAKTKNNKRASSKEVDRIIKRLYMKMEKADFLKLSDQKIADEVFKATGKTTTRQTVSHSPTRKMLKQKHASERASSGRNYRRS